jgi:hypothetical protein
MIAMIIAPDGRREKCFFISFLLAGLARSADPPTARTSLREPIRTGFLVQGLAPDSDAARRRMTTFGRR